MKNEEFINQKLNEKLSSDEMKALFFDSDAIQESPEKIYRLTKVDDDYRYYYKFDEKGIPHFLVSATTAIKRTLPTPPYLIKWIAEMGYDRAMNYVKERAHYGTFLHQEVASYLINGVYDLDKLIDALHIYVESHKLGFEFMFYEYQLKKDFLAIAQFFNDVNFKPIAIEIVLSWDVFAGALDMVGELDIVESGYFGDVYKSGQNAGKPKLTKRTIRDKGIIDLKSGMNGFYESHEIQLHLYKKFWNHNFPQIPINKVFNVAPKKWRGDTPTYSLKDQSDSINAKKLPELCKLAKIENEKKDNDYTLMSGVVEFGKSLSDNCKSVELTELVKKRHDEWKNKKAGTTESDDTPKGGND